MAAQHKRPGRTARLERIRRAKGRQKPKVKVIILSQLVRLEFGLGKIVALGEVANGGRQ